MELIRSTSAMSLILNMQANLYLMPETGVEETEEEENDEVDT